MTDHSSAHDGTVGSSEQTISNIVATSSLPVAINYLSTAHHFVSIKLTTQNFLFWRTQLVSFLLVERRHKHIVETGLTLIAHASIPSHFWNFAFESSVYLIHKMFSSVLGNSSPDHMLHPYIISFAE